MRLIAALLISITTLFASAPLYAACVRPRLGNCHPYRVSTNVVVNVLDYGALDDGATDLNDDTAAFAQAIAAIPSNIGGVVLVPAGLYVIRDSLVIDKAAPIHIMGIGSTASPYGSVLFWRGPSGVPMLRLVGLSDSRVEGLGLAVGPGFELSAAIHSETKYGRSTTRNTFKELYLTSQMSQLYDGIRFMAGDDAPLLGGSGPDDGNDCACFERVSVTNYSHAAFRFMHPSARDHLFVQSQFSCSGYSGGRAGVLTEPFAGRFGGGGFTWIGGGGSLCGVANFELAEPNSPVFIESINSEISTAMLASVGPAQSEAAASVELHSFRHERTGGSTEPMVNWTFAGPLSIHGALFADTATLALRVHPPHASPLTLANNHFFDLDADIQAPSFAVLDSNSNVGLTMYGNQWAMYEGPDYFTTHGPITPPPDVTSPLPAGPALISAPLPPPSAVELMMTTSVYNVTAYGAVANDNFDDTRAFQRAIAAAQSHAQGGIVYAPTGTYRISRTLVIGNHTVIKFRGDGSTRTFLDWTGPADRALLLLDAQRDSVFGYFTIRSTPGRFLRTGIISQTSGQVPLPRLPSNNAFYDILIDGRAGGLGFGFRVAPGLRADNTWNDTNNEFHYFLECRVQFYAEAAYSIEHSQSKTHLFLNSRFDAYGAGNQGVTTAHGINSGSFMWMGGGGGGNRRTDFLLGGNDDFILVRDGYFSGSARFFESGFSTGAWNINLIRNRFSTNRYDSPTVDPNNFIDYRRGGPLVLEQNLFVLTGSVPAAAKVFHQHYFPGSTSAFSNVFSWAGSDATSRVETLGTPERTLRGNTYYDATMTPIVRPSEP